MAGLEAKVSRSEVLSILKNTFSVRIFWWNRPHTSFLGVIGYMVRSRAKLWYGLATTQVSNRVNQRFGMLNPNTWGCDLAWGLPKSQIEWTNGLEPLIQTHRGCDLSWGLPRSQIEWTNGLEPLIQTPRGVIWLGDYPRLKSTEPTVWNP